MALEAARALVAKGASVSAFAKTEAGRAALVGAGASNVHDGDALDPSDVARCMAALGTCGVDAVVSAAGTSAADAPADGDGNLALIQAAAAKGVKACRAGGRVGEGASPP